MPEGKGKSDRLISFPVGEIVLLVCTFYHTFKDPIGFRLWRSNMGYHGLWPSYSDGPTAHYGEAASVALAVEGKSEAI